GEAHGLARALARGSFGFHGPAGVRRRPRRALDLVTKANLLVDAIIGGRLAHVVQDAWPVRDRLRISPRLERIAEREHVAVGADAGIAEQIPGAADAVAPLEDNEALRRTFVLEMIARADAREAGADDQYIEMFHWLGRFHDPISAQMEPKINGKQKGPGSFPSPFHPMSF